MEQNSFKTNTDSLRFLLWWADHSQDVLPSVEAVMWCYIMVHYGLTVMRCCYRNWLVSVNKHPTHLSRVAPAPRGKFPWCHPPQRFTEGGQQFMSVTHLTNTYIMYASDICHMFNMFNMFNCTCTFVCNRCIYSVVANIFVWCLFQIMWCWSE